MSILTGHIGEPLPELGPWRLERLRFPWASWTKRSSRRAVTGAEGSRLGAHLLRDIGLGRDRRVPLPDPWLGY